MTPTTIEAPDQDRLAAPEWTRIELTAAILAGSALFGRMMVPYFDLKTISLLLTVSVDPSGQVVVPMMNGERRLDFLVGNGRLRCWGHHRRGRQRRWRDNRRRAEMMPAGGGATGTAATGVGTLWWITVFGPLAS